jgi:hypothetical protein
MPVGGVQVAALENACDVTIIAFATVVVTLVVAEVRPLGVLCPASTSIGVLVSTPENVWMPPAAPADVENVHV